MASDRLPFDDPPPVVVMRVRPDGRIEARWPALDLCATWASWPDALDDALGRRTPRLYPGAAVGVRVRAGNFAHTPRTHTVF